MNKKDTDRVADFLYEVGTLRKLMRMHSQTLLTNDASDNIASHTFRVAIIGWLLAKEEEVDASKVVMMCLLHDIGEIRSGDQNWIHKKYIKVFEDEISQEQLGDLPYSELKEIADEYDVRESAEAKVAKDADLLDQVLLLREYEWQGNKEAAVWLHGKAGLNPDTDQQAGDGNRQLKRLQTESARRVGEAIYERNPSAWWENVWTDENR